MQSTLRSRTLKGVSWSFIDNIAGSGITFIVAIILARLLTPAEFGVIGMITIFIAISNSIIDSGFSNALIRKHEPTSKDYNTVFIFNLVVSLFLYFFLFVSAPAISRFYNEPQLILVTRVVGLVLICNAFGFTQRTILVKAVDFKTQTKASFIASILSGAIGITMAFMGFGVWSLVAQQLGRQLLNTLLLWIYNDWRPILEFSMQSFFEMFGFGFKLMLSGILNTTFKNIYYLIIGKLYTPDVLGQYTRAEHFKKIFTQNLTSVVQRVSYPTLSSIQDEEVRLLNAYRQVIKVTMLVTFFCMLCMAAIAKPMILILIGSKWLPSVQYLQIMCFAGMFFPLHAINLNILQIKGRSDLCLKLEIYKKFLILIPLALGIFMGIVYLLFGSVLVSIIAFFLNSYYSSKMINYSTRQQLIDIFPSFVISLFTSLTMWAFTFIKWDNWVIILIQMVVGMIISLFLFEKSQLGEYLELKKIVSSFISKK